MRCASPPLREGLAWPILQELERVVHARVCGEEADGVIDVHRQHLADAFLAPAHGECLGVEALTAAYVAQHLHVREEAHLDGLHTLAFAALAASARGIEGE